MNAARTDAWLYLGARARDWVLREYSWDDAARKLEAFYRQLTEGRA